MMGRAPILASGILRSALGVLPILAASPSLRGDTFDATRLNDRLPIIDRSTFAAVGVTSGVSSNINGPSMIRVPDWIPVEERPAADAEYYLYFAHHGGDSIRLAWAASPTGPWQLFNYGSAPARSLAGRVTPGDGVLDLHLGASDTIRAGRVGVGGHIASPDVRVDELNRRLVMYFHGPRQGGGGQKTFVATSRYGLNFNTLADGGEDFPGETHGMREVIPGHFYFRTFEVNGRAFAYSNQAELYRGPSTTSDGQPAALANGDDEGGLWNPPDGFDVTREYWERIPAAENPIQRLYVDHGQGARDPRHFAVHQRPEDPERIYVFYTSREDAPESVFLTVLDLEGLAPAERLEPANWVAVGQRVILEPQEDWEGADLPITRSSGGSATNRRQLRDPFVFHDDRGTAMGEDDRTYLLYTGEGEEAIGIAELLFSTARNTSAPQGDLFGGSGPSCRGVRRELSATGTTAGGAPIQVALSATGVTEPLTVVEALPDGVDVADSGGGDPGGNTLTFRFDSDGEFRYSIVMRAGDCPFVRGEISGLVSPGNCTLRTPLSCFLPPALVSHWTLDADTVEDTRTGAAVHDAAGTNDGTIVGATRQVEGRVGEALEFNGVDTAIDVDHPIDGSLDFGPDRDFTLTAWIRTPRPPVGGQSTILSKGDGGGNARILFKIDGETIFATIGDESGGGPTVNVLGSTPVTDNRWHHVALVADRDELTRVHVDGSLDAAGPASAGTDVSTESDLFIGASVRVGGSTRRYFEGSIDDVRIYNFALTTGEIDQLASAVNGPGSPRFRRGDPNADGVADISDAIFILLHLFLGSATPGCEKAADVNDDGAVNIGDPIHQLAFLFTGGAPPPPPRAVCGADVTTDTLSCKSHPPCRQER